MAVNVTIVRQVGNTVEEVLTQADATSDVLTFSADIYTVEIYHNEDTPQSFIVNGLTLVIADGGWRSSIGGTPSPDVTLPSGVDCIVTRLV